MKGKSVLITGGTGFLGKALAKEFLTKYPEIKRLIIYARGEQKQAEMAQEYKVESFPQIHYCIGDVRDYNRLNQVAKGVDYIVHTAAMKYLSLTEYNPEECIKTNIGGAENVIKAALNNSVAKVVALSTDKACAPNSLYGATKLASDKLFINSSSISHKNDTQFSVVRFGNILGSTGSVVPFFLKRKAEGKTLPVTHTDMTRFNISLHAAVNMVMYALENAWGGELFVPKIPSYKIMDMVEAIAPNLEKEVVGIRSGEKIHEEMISLSDSLNTYDLGKYYVVLPSHPAWEKKDFIAQFNAKRVAKDFSYSSGNNSNWETVESLRGLVNNLNIGA